MHPKHRAHSDETEKQDQNEGEGSVTAARRYDAGVEKSVARGDTAELAKKAEKALEGPEGAELERAAAEGKKSRSAASTKRPTPPRKPAR